MQGRRGVTLIELLVVVNIIAILVGVASVVYSELGDEARCAEVYAVFPQIIRSQAYHAMKSNMYYTGDTHDQLRAHGVDLSAVRYFDYSSFPNEASSFSIRADARDWALGGWILFNADSSPRWTSDGALIKREWLPQ